MVSRVVAYENGGQQDAVPVLLELVTKGKEQRKHRASHLVRLTQVPSIIEGAMQIQGMAITIIITSDHRLCHRCPWRHRCHRRHHRSW